MPFDEIPGADDMERTEKLIQRCIEVRGVKVKIAKVPIPVTYGSAFEGERVRKDIMYAEFGGKRIARLRVPAHAAGRRGRGRQDHRQRPGPGRRSRRAAPLPLGMVVDVSGRKMQTDFEPILERQFHYFINGVEGVQHNGQRDIAWTRISKNTFDKGFRLEHFGKVLHARIHEVFGNIVDKVQVHLTTDAGRGRRAHRGGARRLRASATSASPPSPTSRWTPSTRCLLCQSFAPNHVCVVNPERVGLCGAYNWLDCKASFEINPTGPNQPVPKGIVPRPGEGRVQRAPTSTSTSTPTRPWSASPSTPCMESPMTSCGCFECIMVLVPEANGFMIVSREDPSMTPVRHDLLHPGRHGRRRHADAGHDGHGQVLPHEQQVHLRPTAASSASSG